MDQELIAVLKEMFCEYSEQIRGDFDTLRQEIDQRFQENSAQITTSLRAEIAGLEERLTERIRGNEIMVEGLRDDIRQLADGVARNTEALESFKAEVRAEFAEVRSFFSYHVKRLETKTVRHDKDIAALRRTLKTRSKSS